MSVPEGAVIAGIQVDFGHLFAVGTSPSRPPTLLDSTMLCDWKLNPTSAGKVGHSLTVSPLHYVRPGRPWRR